MLFPYLMKVSLLLAVLTLGYRWLIQFETFSKLNRALLWLNVLAAWSLPLIPLANWGPVKVQTEFHQTIPKIAKVVPVVRHEISSLNPAKSIINSQHLPHWNVMDVLTLIYLTGVAVMLAVFLFQVGRLIRLLWISPSQKSAEGIIFIQDEHNTSPYSFFRWVVYNPQNHSKNTLQHIVAHETEHVLQWHSLDLLLAELQRIALWFNPLAWFHQRLVQANLEYLADRGVLDRGCEKKEYQFDLLRTVLQNRELPLTNSFAQSLLKKRIRMMNKKPSHYLAWGKYGLLIGILYLSSAFVAPYTIKIIKLATPGIQPIVKTFVENSVTIPKLDVERDKEEPNEIKAVTLIENTVDSISTEPQKKQVKGIIIKNDTLYWAISPLTTWEDISLMRKEINKFGGEIQINGLQFDPFQNFITAVSVYTFSGGKGSSGQGSTEEKDFMPIHGYSGFIRKNAIGMGQLPPAPLSNELQNDYQQALALHKLNEVAYFQHNLVKSIGPNSSSGYTRESFEGKYAAKILENSGIGKSSQNTLKLPETYKDASLYLNTKAATLEEINALPFEKFEKMSIVEDRAGKKYVIIYAK